MKTRFANFILFFYPKPFFQFTWGTDEHEQGAWNIWITPNRQSQNDEALWMFTICKPLERSLGFMFFRWLPFWNSWRCPSGLDRGWLDPSGLSRRNWGDNKARRAPKQASPIHWGFLGGTRPKENKSLFPANSFPCHPSIFQARRGSVCCGDEKKEIKKAMDCSTAFYG